MSNPNTAACFTVLRLMQNDRHSLNIGSFPSKVVVYQKRISIEGHLPRVPSKVIFHKWSSVIADCFPLEVTIHLRMPSIQSEVVFHRQSSSIGSRLPSEVVFLRRSSSIGGRLPLVAQVRRTDWKKQKKKYYKLGWLESSWNLSWIGFYIKIK